MSSSRRRRTQLSRLALGHPPRRGIGFTGPGTKSMPIRAPKRAYRSPSSADDFLLAVKGARSHCRVAADPCRRTMGKCRGPGWTRINRRPSQSGRVRLPAGSSGRRRSRRRSWEPPCPQRVGRDSVVDRRHRLEVGSREHARSGRGAGGTLAAGPDADGGFFLRVRLPLAPAPGLAAAS